MALARLSSSWSWEICLAKSGVEDVIGAGAGGAGMEEEDEICTFSPGNKLKGVSTPVAEIC